MNLRPQNSEPTRVCFPRVIYSVPDTGARLYLTGLAPNTGYSITVRLSNDSLQVTIAPGGAAQSDSAGVLAF